MPSVAYNICCVLLCMSDVTSLFTCSISHRTHTSADCLQYCKPAVLYLQEHRTLASNNVEGGHWFGKTQLVYVPTTLPIFAAPTSETMDEAAAAKAKGFDA